MKVYRIRDTHSSQYMVTGPENEGPDGDGYWIGVFRSRFNAQLFVKALELADMGAPILDGLMEDEDDSE